MPAFRKGRISARFRNISILLFVASLVLILAMLLVAFNGIIDRVSLANAERYAVSSSEAFSAHIRKEIGLMAKAAGSPAVVGWLLDEWDGQKESQAFAELLGIIDMLYSYNVYVGIEGSRNEYRIDRARADEGFAMLDRPLSREEEDDGWYFECTGSDGEYTLRLGIDNELNRKRVFINYKVVHDGSPIGVICTGLEFFHVAGELFSKYDSLNMRGLIVDADGYVTMDSLLVADGAYQYGDDPAHLDDVIGMPAIAEVIASFPMGDGGFYDYSGDPVVVELGSGPYRFMTVVPVRHTDWSAVILYDSISFIEIHAFVPVLAIMLAILVSFAVAISFSGKRLIFSPLEKISASLERLDDDSAGQIYGTGRDDELGDLSNTIQDLFRKANYDALTGIFNRRSMENRLNRAMDYLSRSSAYLSVFMVDVDCFKKYNDTYGHESGDGCLKAVAKTLEAGVTRANDFVARYGGEEFIVVLPHADEPGAKGIAEKLLASILALRIPHSGNAASEFVTVSIGVTTGTVNFDQTWEEYAKRADEALYLSKRNGRNRYTFLPVRKAAPPAP